MAVTLPASATLEGTLDNSNIGLEEGLFDEGKERDYVSVKKTLPSSHSWKATGTTITGKVIPQEKYGLVVWDTSRTYACNTSASSPLTITNNSGKSAFCRFLIRFRIMAR